MDKEEKLMSKLDEEIDELDEQLEEKVEEQERAKLNYQKAQAASQRRAQTLGAPKIKEFAKVITGATSSVIKALDFTKKSTETP